MIVGHKSMESMIIFNIRRKSNKSKPSFFNEVRFKSSLFPASSERSLGEKMSQTSWECSNTRSDGSDLFTMITTSTAVIY